MKEVFADAHYFIAILNRRDQFHAAALAASQRQGMQIVTTHWVLVETADALRDPLTRKATEQFIRSLLTDSETHVLSDLALFHSGLELYAKRADKDWSLTDCISFSVMESRGIREALTGDHHFKQAGYVALLAGKA